MKKFLTYLIFCLCLTTSTVIADESSNANWGIAPVNDKEAAREAEYDDTQGSDDFFDEEIYDEYGSNKSPAFNNRQNINPNESDYGFGQTDGYR